jgi:DNA-binding SARP family transcriptional activator
VSRVRLQVLGGAGLHAHGAESAAVLVQPKRFGLLVFLALRRRGSYVRRDELMGVFWPDSTESRARASLRQALRFLRLELGADVVVNRGQAEVGIDPTALACDAVAFLEAVEHGDDRAVVDRYSGELLPGFIIDGAWEFDRWLQGERQRLRSLALNAALRQADAREDADDPVGAAEGVQWALRLDPTNEAVARRLISLLARAGATSAAIAAYEALAERLAEDLDLEPSPETAELVAAVREAGSTVAGSVHAGRTKALSPQRVLVLELANLTDDASLSAIGRLAADAIAQGLATIPALEVVPPLALGGAGGAASRTVEHGPGIDASGVSPELMELARRTGAGTLLDGAYHLEHDRLRFQLRITDVVRGRLLPGPEPVVTPRSTPLDGVATLREQAMITLGRALTPRAVHVREAARPPGMDAFRAYLDGLEHFIRGEWRAALADFRRSADLEPEYALPRIVCSIALWNLGELADAQSAAMEAARLTGSLGRFERAVLDMVLAWLRGDWAEAHRASAVQAEIAPGSIPHFQVAEEARRLNRPREAREVLSRLDPAEGELRGWIFYWVELAAAHHLMGDHARELELASRCRRLHPDEPAAALLEIRALAALGRDADVVRVIDQALSSPSSRQQLAGSLLIDAALELRAHGTADAAAPLLERAVAWFREITGDDAPADVRRQLGRALYYAGDLAVARRVFLELTRSSGDVVQPIGYHHGQLQAHLDTGYLAVIAVQQGDEEETTRWCSRLSELDGRFLYGAQWFWLAAVAAVRGDREQAVSMLRRAFADGLPMELFVHTDPHLGRLRGHPRFEAIMRPRG